MCGDHGGADIVANLLLFLPFGIGLRLAGVSWRRIVLLSAGISFTVELLQLVAIPGRDASLSDVLTNTGSGAIGAALAPHLPEALRPSRRRARRLLAGGVSVWLAAMGASAWLLEPSLAEGPLWSGWAGPAGSRGAFLGSVAAVWLEGRTMPKDGVPPDSAKLRQRLDGGQFSLEANVTSGRPVSYSAWIYELRVDSSDHLTLFQFGRLAGISVATRGRELRANPVTVTIPDGLPAAAGVPVRLQASLRDGIIRLRSIFGGVSRDVELGLSPAYGWRLISPFELGAGTGVRWFTALCLALSVLPLAYWAGRTGGSARWIPAVTTAAGLTVPARLAGLPPPHWSEWLAAGSGLLAGWALERGAAYLERRCASPSVSEFSSS